MQIPHPQTFNNVCLINAVTAERCITDGEVRLANGTTAYDGRVEICFGKQWGTVCDIQWGASDARVVCRQLSLPTICKLKKTASFFLLNDLRTFRC